MTRRLQLRLLARAALFAVPGVQVTQQPTDEGFRLIPDTLVGAGDQAWNAGSAAIVNAGLVKKRPFPVGAEEWRLAVRDALAELQREADTADHARPEPPTAHVYDVHSPGNPVVTCLAADLPRTVGDIQKTGRPSRVSARLPRCEPSTVDALDGVVREPIEDETTRQYPALRLVTGEGV